MHKFTSPWEPFDICVGGVVGNSKGHSARICDKGDEGGLQSRNVKRGTLVGKSTPSLPQEVTLARCGGRC